MNRENVRVCENGRRSEDNTRAGGAPQGFKVHHNESPGTRCWLKQPRRHPSRALCPEQAGTTVKKTDGVKTAATDRASHWRWIRRFFVGYQRAAGEVVLREGPGEKKRAVCNEFLRCCLDLLYSRGGEKESILL